MTAYNITTVDELQAIMSTDPEGDYTLANDIDASATRTWNPSGDIYEGFIPIGTSVSPFKGTLNGNGFKISNLYVNRPGTGNYCGLFGCIRSAASEEKVTNGTFTGSSTGWTVGTGWTWVDAANDYMQLSPTAGQGTLSQTPSGGIVIGQVYVLVYTISGYSAGTITPSCGGVTLTSRSGNGTFTEQFTATSTADLVFTPSSTPVDSANLRIDTVSLIRVLTFKDLTIENADITGAYAGIFAANIESPGRVYSIIDNIVANGSVTASNDVGGFANVINASTITDCTTDSIVTLTTVGGGIDAGGFAGTLVDCDISNCESNGVVTSSAEFSGSSGVSKAIGGFVGSLQTALSVITNCHSKVAVLANNTNASSQTWSGIGGFIGYAVVAPTITKCSFKGTIVYLGSEGTNIGGFIGIGITVTKCFAVGSIEAPNVISSTLDVGGFSGTGSAATDCYARVDLLQDGVANPALVNCGGFCGASGTNQTTCYAAGKVNTSVGKFGGFTGNKTGGTNSNCYFDKDVAGTSTGKMGTGSATGITGLSTSLMQLSGSFTGFDFTTIWEMGIAVTPQTLGSNITLWLSKKGDYDDFESGILDDSSFSFDIPTQNEIRWLASLESLLLGTSGDEWKVGSNKLDTPVTPTNFTVKQQTEYGSSRIQPIKINSSILFVDYVSRKLREMTYVEPKYESPDLTALAEHITKSGITSMSRQKNPDSLLWFTRGDGSLISQTYDREQNVVSWSKHPLGGNGFAQSVCVLPNSEEDVIYVSVAYTLDGENITYESDLVTYEGEQVTDYIGDVVYIQKMGSRTFDSLEDCFFVDCGITFESVTPTSTITGLSHLNGENVCILASGGELTEPTELDDCVVSNGQITAQLNGQAVLITKAQVGMRYRYILQPMRIVVNGPDGSTLGSIGNIKELCISFYETMDCDYGISDSDLQYIDFDDIRWINSSNIDGLFTGDVVMAMPGDFSVYTPVILSSNGPMPCTVRCMIPRIDFVGR